MKINLALLIRNRVKFVQLFETLVTKSLGAMKGTTPEPLIMKSNPLNIASGNLVPLIIVCGLIPPQLRNSPSSKPPGYHRI